MLVLLRGSRASFAALPVRVLLTVSESPLDDPLAQLHATIEYHRREQLAYFAAHPAALAAVREERARLNDYLVERGLRPLADRYPELSSSAGTASPAESGHEIER